MIDRDRRFHRLMAATLKRKAEDRHARKALRKSVIHVSGRFCWVKVNGQWLYKTRQIVTAPGALDALASKPPCPDPFSPALRKTHPPANALKPEDTLRPTIGVELSLATRPSILSGESSVT